MSTTPSAEPTARAARSLPPVRLVVWSVLVALLLVPRAPVPAVDEGSGRPFAASSPFNVPVGADAGTDPDSAAMVARATRTGKAAANLYAYGVPVYHAQQDDPTYAVSCTRSQEWGSCPLSKGRRHIPAGAEPSPGTDGAMVVVQDDGTVDEYWQARRTGSTWTASWGAVNAWDGSGWGGASTGSGASRLGGVVRVAEIRSGTIDHALAVQSDSVCAIVFRPPALKTDGDSERPDCLPEGARLQLDPSLDLGTLRGLTPAERAVAQALQTYGAYVMDRSGTPLSISFETARDATPTSPGSVYRSAGLSYDYDTMPHVPWRRLRVLDRAAG